MRRMNQQLTPRLMPGPPTNYWWRGRARAPRVASLNTNAATPPLSAPFRLCLEELVALVNRPLRSLPSVASAVWEAVTSRKTR